MGLIQDKWKEEECRAEDGVFFANDEYIPLHSNGEGDFQAGLRQPAQSLVEQDPEIWTDIWPSCEHSNEEFTAVGGAGSWEGEGFVALLAKASQELIWVLHLHNMEGVTEIVIEAKVIRATAHYYPTTNFLTIPMLEPEKVVIESKREL